MAIFYTDTGSFNQIEVTGSTILSGSLIVSGATNFGQGGLTGSLFGTASYANLVELLSLEQINAAIAGEEITPYTVTATEISASFVKVVAPAPNNLAMITTGSHEITGSISLIGNISASSFIGNIITSSHVQLNGLTDTTATNKVLVLDTATNKIFTTASVGGGGGSGPAFPFSGSAVITGSLLVTGSGLRVSGTLDARTGSIADLTVGNTTLSKLKLGSENVFIVGGGGTTMNIQAPLSIDMTAAGSSALLIDGDNSNMTINVNPFINAALTVSGITALNGGATATTINATSVTASFTGSFNGSIARFSPAALRITVGTTAPSSPAVNDLWIDTN
jgi:hypothetical protein